MADTPGIREVSFNKPSYVDFVADVTKGLNLNEKGQALVKEVVGLLGTDRSVRVTNTLANNRAEAGTPTGATGTPAIDNPSDPKGKQVDLEKLMLFLQLEETEEQEAAAKDRIESQKDNIANQHKERMEKLEESLKKMDEAATSGIFSKIFGWLMAAVAVVVAVAACVATGGIAVGAVAAAVIAVGAMILNETGAMDKIVEGLADLLESMGMNKDAAKIVAQVAIAVAIMAATIACGGTSMSVAFTNVAEEVAQTAQTIQKIADIAMKVVGLMSVVANGVAAYKGYESGMAQADLTEATKVLQQLRQQLEDSQEELQAILQLIQNIYSNIVTLLQTETDTQNTLANNLGQMA
ncbi:MAG: type III secretion system translocon subunit SctE [Victivallales bacterium]|nr:type III secretion system translocon subunit SctE [Victivallales bacterium]